MSRQNKFDSRWFSALSTCANEAVLRYQCIIVPWSFSKTKGFFCFSFNNRCHLENWGLFCISYFSKTKSKPAKKIQNVFLSNWKWHAKFQALLQKKEKHFRSSLSMVLHLALQILCVTTSADTFGWASSKFAMVCCKSSNLFVILSKSRSLISVVAVQSGSMNCQIVNWAC